jgi:Alpha amylase, catalytic domain
MREKTMAGDVRYPSLYQINTRVWLRRLSRQQGKTVTLKDVPDDELDRIAALGFDWVWLLSVWQTGEASRAVSRSHPGWLREYRELLPDLTEDDICGSGFAITGYTASTALGGAPALADIRQRLATRGLKLMLDHVPNHTGLGHPWIKTHPNYFVCGSEQDLQRQPQNFVRVETHTGPRIFAYGRDPNFDGWPDTLQLDYGNPDLQDARIAELLDIAGQCEGVRCDMAMLVLPEVFRRTWDIDMASFWPRAIARVREQYPDFLFMAESYWDLEWTLQQQGFDYCYDKRLYDRLRDGGARPVRDHLVAPLDYQDKLARFLENHDEPRAAATFDLPQHRAAAAVAFFAPGLRFSNRVSSMAGTSTSRRTCAGRRTNRSTPRSGRSTRGCWRCWARTSFVTATGCDWSRNRPHPAAAASIISLAACGEVRMASFFSSSSITATPAASAACVCPSTTFGTSGCASPTASARRFTTVTGPNCWPPGCSSTMTPGT